MHSRNVFNARLGRVTVRPLPNGDTEAVAAVFDRRSDGPEIPSSRVARLARVESERHALVAYVDGDPQPAGLAQLARDGADAAITVTVADRYQGDGVDSVLVELLAGDARAAGVARLTVASAPPISRRRWHHRRRLRPLAA